MDNRDIVAATLAAAVFQKLWPASDLGRTDVSDAESQRAAELAITHAITLFRLVRDELPDDGG